MAEQPVNRDPLVERSEIVKILERVKDECELLIKVNRGDLPVLQELQGTLRRALAGAMPDLFDNSIADSHGLQDKADEIIVKGRGAKGAGDHHAFLRYRPG